MCHGLDLVAILSPRDFAQAMYSLVALPVFQILIGVQKNLIRIWGGSFSPKSHRKLWQQLLPYAGLQGGLSDYETPLRLGMRLNAMNRFPFERSA